MKLPVNIRKLVSYTIFGSTRCCQVLPLPETNRDVVPHGYKRDGKNIEIETPVRIMQYNSTAPLTADFKMLS